MDSELLLQSLRSADPGWSDQAGALARSQLGELPTSATALASELHLPADIAPESVGGYLSAAKALAAGKYDEATAAAMAATAGLICASTGPAAPACLGAAAFAAVALPLGQELAKLIGERTLPPSLVATPVIEPGHEPLLAQESIAIVNATERLRQSEQAAFLRLAMGFAATWRNLTGEDPPDETTADQVAGALSRAGYRWDPVLPLPSWQQDRLDVMVLDWQSKGASQDWIAAASRDFLNQCASAQLVVACAAGNDLWRRIPIDTVDARPTANQVLAEVKTRAAVLPGAVIKAATDLAARAVTDARKAWQEAHPGVTVEQYTAFQQAAGDHAAAVAAQASAGAARAALEAREIGLGGGLDVSGSSGGAGAGWVGGLVIGGFALAFLALRRGR